LKSFSQRREFEHNFITHTGLKGFNGNVIPEERLDGGLIYKGNPKVFGAKTSPLG